MARERFLAVHTFTQEEMNIVARTDIGKLRDRNEDGHYFDASLQLFAVADGMSGHERGDLASRIALSVIEEWAADKARPHGDLGHIQKLEILSELATEANRRVYATAQAQSQHRGMGTTLVAGFATASYLAYVYVGDSRLYVLHDETLTQITTDDTLVQKMVDEGKITAEESRVHAKRNILMQAIGLSPTVTINTDVHPLTPGDIILACTDGLHDLVIDDAEIADTILAAPNLEAAGENLVTKAIDYGGTDNVTVLLAAVE